MSRDILDIPSAPADHRIPYGDDPLQFAELRLPSGAGLHPVVIVVHGGCWEAQYTLDHIGHLCAALTETGLATWNIEYRRVGDVGGGWPNTLLDVAAGADHLRHIASRYNLDLTRILSLGHSAGGHLAMWLAARHRLPEGDPLFNEYPLNLEGAIALAGILDLRRAHELHVCNGAVKALMGGEPDERYHTASPAELLPLGTRQLLIHGDEDQIVPISMSEEYHADATAKGDDAAFMRLPGAGHFELIDPRWSGWSGIRDAIVSLTSDGPGPRNEI